MGGLEALPWGVLTPLGVLMMLCIYVVRSVVRGDLVPRKTYEDALKREAKWQEVAEERSAQLTTLLPSVDVATKMIEALVVTKSRDTEQ